MINFNKYNFLTFFELFLPFLIIKTDSATLNKFLQPTLNGINIFFSFTKRNILFSNKQIVFSILN